MDNDKQHLKPTQLALHRPRTAIDQSGLCFMVGVLFLAVSYLSRKTLSINCPPLETSIEKLQWNVIVLVDHRHDGIRYRAAVYAGEAFNYYSFI